MSRTLHDSATEPDLDGETLDVKATFFTAPIVTISARGFKSVSVAGVRGLRSLIGALQACDDSIQDRLSELNEVEQEA